MSAPLILVYLALVVTILRQFSSRMSPSRSLGWWFTFLLLGIAVVDANLFGPLAKVLGFQLISNFLFAAMIFLALFESILQSSYSTKTARQLRFLVARQASNDFLQAFRQPHPEADVLIVVPCYNEEASLPQTLDRLEKLLDSWPGRAVVCCIDDGSRDTTWKVLRARQRPGIYATRHAVNVGVSGVLLTAFLIQQEADFAYVVQCDADGQHPIDQIPVLLDKAKRESLDLTLGSRFAATNDGSRGARDQSSTTARRGGGLLIKAVLGLFGGRAMVDDPTSGFRVFSHRLGKLLTLQMPDDYPEPETIALTAGKGWRIGEQRVVMLERTAGTSSINRLGAVRYMYKVITALIALRLTSPSRR